MPRLLYALFLGLALALPASGSEPASPVATTPPPTEEGAAPVDVAAVFSAWNRRTLAVLEADFPDDHQALMAKLDALQSSGESEGQILFEVFGEMTGMRRNYAQKLVFAPDAALATVLIRLAAFYDQVFAREGAQVCGEFAQDGSAVLFAHGLAAKYAGALDLQSEAYFSAVVAAIEEPQYHEAPEDSDWRAVFAAMVGGGSPLSYAASIAAGSREDPQLCPALAAIFRTSAGLNTPAGGRIRADFAKNLAGY